MFARLLKYQTNIDRIDKASKLFHDTVIPMCKTQKGYKGAFFLADRATGECMPMTLWKTEEDMLANEKSLFFQEQVVKFINFFKSPPIREAYEVIIRDGKIF